MEGVSMVVTHQASTCLSSEMTLMAFASGVKRLASARTASPKLLLPLRTIPELLTG